MPNYANSKVYKIINSVDGKIYIGSTTVSLSRRLTKHKATAKATPSFAHRHFNTIGWDKVRIVLIENVTCFNKEQLIQREQHYIDLLKPSLNTRPAYVDCLHGRRHNNCIECHGTSICIHNKQKAYCKICGGSQICEHNKQKSNCKICSPKYCECCDITICKTIYKRHTNSINHIYNFIYS